MKLYCEIDIADKEEMGCCELPGYQAPEVRIGGR